MRPPSAPGASRTLPPPRAPDAPRRRRAPGRPLLAGFGGPSPAGEPQTHPASGGPRTAGQQTDPHQPGPLSYGQLDPPAIVSPGPDEALQRSIQLAFDDQLEPLARPRLLRR